MKMINQLRLEGFINPLVRFPSFVVPILRGDFGYCVQDVDETGKIVRFCKCDIAAYTLMEAPALPIRIGDDPLYGFIFEDADLIWGSKAQLATQLLGRIDDLREHPFVHGEVASFVDAEGEVSVAANNAHEIIRELDGDAAERWISEKRRDLD